jgi:hypothetical protein
MAQYEQVIETEIDGLVNLIKQRGKISVNDAAKELEVSNIIITGWAESLEAKGLINIEFGLFNTYLVPRQMSREDVESHKKAFNGRKEAIIGKAEGTLNYFAKEKEKFRFLVDEFSKLRKMLDRDSSIKTELEHLENIEKVKKAHAQNIQKSRQKILDLKAVTNKFMDEVRKERQYLRQMISESARQKKRVAQIEKSKKHLLVCIRRIDRKLASIDSFIRLGGRRDALEGELSAFIKNAKSTEISAKNGDSGKNVLGLQQKLDDFIKKKESFAEDYGKAQVLQELSQIM